jgi:hypothetical protein
LFRTEEVRAVNAEDETTKDSRVKIVMKVIHGASALSFSLFPHSVNLNAIKVAMSLQTRIRDHPIRSFRGPTDTVSNEPIRQEQTGIQHNVLIMTITAVALTTTR